MSSNDTLRDDPSEEDLIQEIDHLEQKAREIGEPEDPFDWGMLMFFSTLAKDRRKRLATLRAGSGGKLKG